MKKSVLIMLFSIFIVPILWAQEDPFTRKTQELSQEIEQVVQEEKDRLKDDLKLLKEQYNKGEINERAYEEKSSQLAEEAAQRIDERTAIIHEELNELIEDKVNGEIADYNAMDTVKEHEEVRSITISGNVEIDLRRKPKNQYQSLSIGLGGGNLMNGFDFGSLDSRFDTPRGGEFTIGYHHYRRLGTLDKSLFLRYGVDFVWNKLAVSDNKYFVKNENGNPILETYPLNTKKVKLKSTFIQIPISLEWHLGKLHTYDEKEYRKPNHGFRIGIGGYAGFRLRSKQKIIYFNENDRRRRDNNVDNYKVNDIQLGAQFIAGWGLFTFYLKKDFTDYFKTWDSDTNQFTTFGLRVDL